MTEAPGQVLKLPTHPPTTDTENRTPTMPQNTYATMRDLLTDWARSIDAGFAHASEYDLEAMAYDLTTDTAAGIIPCDADTFWESLPNYARD